MQSININERLVESYLELLENLSPNSKLDLIKGLSMSLKVEKENNLHVLKSLGDDFIPEKLAEEVIRDLKTARTFTRKIEEF